MVREARGGEGAGAPAWGHMARVHVREFGERLPCLSPNFLFIRHVGSSCKTSIAGQAG